MFGFKFSAILAVALFVIAIGGLFVGSTWFSLVTGIAALFAALWWVGSYEEERVKFIA